MSTPGGVIESPGALDGVRIVELASEHGAFAGKILADLGAEVIVVEPPGGHATRQFEPYFDDLPDPEGSLWWWSYNAGKLSVALDLRETTDAERFRELVASSDLVLEGEPPGYLSGLGLDYEDLATDHRELVWTSITPFGRRDPRSHEPVTDLTILAGAGPAWSCGYDDHRLPPVRPGGNQAYHTACAWAVMASMVALFARRTLGTGQHVDVSMDAASNVTTEAATYEWLVARATVERQTFRHAAVRPTPPRQMNSADGGSVIGALPRYAGEFRALIDWIVELGIVELIDEFFFLEMGVERGGVRVPEIASDPEAAAIYQAGADALRTVAGHLPAREFFVEAQRRDIPSGVLFAPEDVMEDEHFIARGFPILVHHEDRDRSFVYPGAAFHAPRSPWAVRRRAPHVGEHTDDVLGGLEHPREAEKA
jgi:crotonobetainyl-CoA:carnitine CoA-transferase CaiB-like acyl-CoA transferase